MNLKNNKILITGGATGIGLRMAERFIQEGNTVIICGRRQRALDDAKRNLPGLITKRFDLSIGLERKDLFDWIVKEHNDLTVLINNAGIQNWVNVTDDDFYFRAKEEMAINIEAPVHLVSLFIKLPSLKTIINICSALSFLPVIKTPIFSASKAFLHSFTISIRELLKPKGIEVIEMIPPALNTDLGGAKKENSYATKIEDYIDSVFEQLAEGRLQLSFRFSELMTKANPDELDQAFKSINQLN